MTHFNAKYPGNIADDILSVCPWSCLVSLQVMMVTTESSSTSNALTSGASAASGAVKGLHKELLADLEAVGAAFVTFNPVTEANLTKVWRVGGRGGRFQAPK